MIAYEHLVAFFIALIVAFFSTPIAKKIAFRSGAVDIPKDETRMHKKPMALMGGLAVISGFSVSALYGFSSRDFSGFLVMMGTGRFLGPFFGALIIIAMGIADDITPLKARTKLPFQLVAAVLAAATGTRVMAISKPFQMGAAGGSDMMFFVGDAVSFIVTILWIVGVTNAINLIDGLDGLSAGVSGIAALSLFIVATVRRQPEIALVSIALFGAVMGFLPYNFNPAKIFSGSTGAYFLGFMLAIISVSGTMKSVTAISLAVPILVLGLPLFDTLFAMARRLVNGRPIGERDRGHIHHRLVDMGLSHRMSVTILYVVSAALGLVSIALTDKGLLLAILLVVFILIFMIGGARNLTEMRSEKETRGLVPDRRIAQEPASGPQDPDLGPQEPASGPQDPDLGPQEPASGPQDPDFSWIADPGREPTPDSGNQPKREAPDEEGQP